MHLGFWRSSPPLVSCANTAALKRAGITRDTVSPDPTLEIERDANGDPTGLKAKTRIYSAVKNYRQPMVGRINGQGVLYQLRCIGANDDSPKGSALLIRDGKTDHECAKKLRKKAR